jgi:hypothetical protein
MLNSSVLDVAIGLAFIYLLLGLMCTTVNEWLAQMLKTRASTLKEGIRRLLHAPPDGTYLIRAVDIDVAALAKRFGNADDKLTKAVGAFDPGLQAVTDQFVANLTAKPGAQPPTGLAVTLAAKLSALISQTGLIQKIDDAKVTPETKAEIAKQPRGNDLLRLNRALLSEAYPEEITSLSDSFYNHPLIKSLARPGDHPSYVPAKTFALTLLDIFGKGAAAADTAGQGVAQIKASIEVLPDSDVKKSLQALLAHGADTVEDVEKKLEDWFENSMDRVSGWYKNRVQVWTIVIASLITIFANADTLQIARRLMVNPAVREKIVQEAAATVKEGSPPASESALKPTLTSQQRADLDSLTGWSQEFRVFHRLEACADQSLRLAGQSETDCRAEARQPTKVNTNPKFLAAWNNDEFPGFDLFGASLFPWLWAIVPTHLIGWIFTAIAASLGAPFWFDTLNKFMNIRAAGTAPNEKDSDKSKA